jgi:hypothetical protein
LKIRTHDGPISYDPEVMLTMVVTLQTCLLPIDNDNEVSTNNDNSVKP